MHGHYQIPLVENTFFQNQCMYFWWEVVQSKKKKKICRPTVRYPPKKSRFWYTKNVITQILSSDSGNRFFPDDDLLLADLLRAKVVQMRQTTPLGGPLYHPKYFPPDRIKNGCLPEEL